MLVTNEFKSQFDPLTLEDFKSVSSVLSEVPSLVFYNCGVDSGASQPHKHIQVSIVCVDFIHSSFHSLSMSPINVLLIRLWRSNQSSLTLTRLGIVLFISFRTFCAESVKKRRLLLPPFLAIIRDCWSAITTHPIIS